MENKGLLFLNKYLEIFLSIFIPYSGIKAENWCTEKRHVPKMEVARRPGFDLHETCIFELSKTSPFNGVQVTFRVKVTLKSGKKFILLFHLRKTQKYTPLKKIWKPLKKSHRV